MDTSRLKKFAHFARRYLMEQVAAKLDFVLATDSAARRESPEAMKKIEERIKKNGKDQVIEQVAYIWFNRFCALCFMDVNRYTRIGVISPAEGQFQPEILAEAKMGHIDEDMIPGKTRQMILSFLDGKAPSRDPQNEAYRLLVVAACNYWNKAMPFLFQRINDYTELLMPNDLLSASSVLASTREALTPEICEDVEVIGWLYQFYISEKKDEVFDGLKKNKKITPENIPAATQLFTPHWIVRYLVENSLGRLWLLNRPGSKLALQMDYYIKPEKAETDFLRIGKPEEIKICDPACGSGHMLTYAFDLFYAIYEEEGYEPAEIPEKILTHNLYGIEIDERAGELAAFALTMKARAKQRRFFNKGVKPNICVLENVRFDEGELKKYMDFVGRDLFSAPLQNTLRQFEEADNFGSLIRPDVTDVDGIRKILESKNVSGHLFLSLTHQKVLQALRQADYLSPKYHVVIANPPYFGPKQMSEALKDFAQNYYPKTKTDLYAMFVERGFTLCLKHCYMAMVTMQSWMFLHSFESMRKDLLSSKTILTMAHLGARAFETISGEVVTVTAFCCYDGILPQYESTFLRLTDGNHIKKERRLREKINCYKGIKQSDFEIIPGSPVAYWISGKLKEAFRREKISDLTISDGQNITADNDRFVRCHWEVDNESIGHGEKWLLYAKGGPFRRWYGNLDFIVDWSDEARGFYRKNSSARIIPEYLWYRPGVTWSRVGTTLAGFRLLPNNSTFDKVGSSVFLTDDQQIPFVLCLLNTKVAQNVLDVLNPSIDIQVKDVRNIPVINGVHQEKINSIAAELIKISKRDWDFYEVSRDFISAPFVQAEHHQPTLKATYQKLRTHWREMTLEMQRLEVENNRIFIDAYGLHDELTPEVPLSEVTLICNPHFRYGNDKSADELEALLLADTMRELVSYAVGCMFGRYALDKPGLILANQGDMIEDYYKKIFDHEKHETHEKEEDENFRNFRAFRGRCLFPADEDNVIPMLDGDWFTDDIAERFRKFLRVAFGEEHYEANLQFVEKALGKNGKARDIRDYFLKDFYNDHIRRYKKRPIYWLFSSPKGTFNALIYMHRYRPDTVSIVLNDYLREFRAKLAARKSHLEQVSISSSASQSEKTKALKEIEKLSKMIRELDDYEREVLYPLATEQKEIDLDDGVKVNYCKFGAALKKIPGLDAKEE